MGWAGSGLAMSFTVHGPAWQWLGLAMTGLDMPCSSYG
jgi:hypothetical protein